MDSLQAPILLTCSVCLPLKRDSQTMTPQTLTVELKNSMALKLLKNLESLKVIKILGSTDSASKPELASTMQGSITAEQADAMHKELGKMRGEWERDI
jgi:hypothetical protein